MLGTGGVRHARESFHVLVKRLEWSVRRGIPDHDKSRFILFVCLFNEPEGFIDQDFRRFPFDVLGRAVATKQWIEVELIGFAEPVVEAEFTRVVRIGQRQWMTVWPMYGIEMPFSEMSGRIPGVSKCRRKGLFLFVD